MRFFTSYCAIGAAVTGWHLASATTCDIYKPVSLDEYGIFSGTTINQTLKGDPLPQVVDAWLGMDYSTQPVGKAGRFKPVSWPSRFSGVKDASQYGKTCIQDVNESDVELQSEACLNFNVFRPKNVPLEQKLPALVWIHGGSMNFGDWSSFDGPSFVAHSEAPIMVVTFHYRTNSLGFLPSKMMEEEGLLNLGLRDQKLFLQFMQKHIGSFGGDPHAITLGGRSAGAHSAAQHHFHNYNEDTGKPLFARAIHQSGSATARAFPNATYPLYKVQFERFMDYLGCPSGEGHNEEALTCLRSADIDEIRNISTTLYQQYKPPITWPFQPCAGGPLVEKFGSQSGVDGTFFHIPTITSATTDEGKRFSGDDQETNQEFLDFMHNISPDLTDDDISQLEKLYPDPATVPSSPYVNSPNSTQYDRVSAAWGDYAYICPSQETAYRLSIADVPTWKLRFNTNQSFPAWQGLPHTADRDYGWADPDVQYPEISKVYHGYLASFVASGDPNTLRYDKSPYWPRYELEGYGLESIPGVQLVVEPNNTRSEKDTIRREQCLYWRDPERQLRMKK